MPGGGDASCVDLSHGGIPVPIARLVLGACCSTGAWPTPANPSQRERGRHSTTKATPGVRDAAATWPPGLWCVYNSAAQSAAATWDYRGRSTMQKQLDGS